jgi:acetyl-CoA carboxylase biotin carboxyl carrier protein
MDIRKVKKLIELMEESDITEIEIKEGGESVRIARHSRVPKDSGAAQLMKAEALVRESKVGEPIAAAKVTAKGQVVSAPMVGTFYLAPSPGSPPFVEVGKRVKVGDTLCIIESMKMMNQIKSEVSGILEAVLVSNEDTVEFDQPIFTVS